MTAMLGQIGLRPEKIRSGKHLKKIDEVVMTLLRKNDYVVLDRRITYHSNMMGYSMTYKEFLEKYKSIYFYDFSYMLTGENFSVEISKKPFCHVALCLEVNGDYDKQRDIAKFLTNIDYEVLSWKKTDFLSESDYRERIERKNNWRTAILTILGAVVGSAATVLVTKLLEG